MCLWFAYPWFPGHTQISATAKRQTKQIKRIGYHLPSSCVKDKSQDIFPENTCNSSFWFLYYIPIRLTTYCNAKSSLNPAFMRISPVKLFKLKNVGPEPSPINVYTSLDPGYRNNVCFTFIIFVSYKSKKQFYPKRAKLLGKKIDWSS